MIQSFIIDPSLSDNTHAYVTSVDVYFQTKSSTNGVSVAIHEMENGVPTSRILPFSTLHLLSDQVEVSANGSTATRFTFPAPIAVKTNIEYGLNISPDAMDPDYKVWISRIGETDVASGSIVTQDTNAGMIFTSTNGRSWTPYQTENLKFKLNIAEFAASYGEATFTTDAYEFLELTGTLGNFIPGEMVYVQRAYEAGTISLTQGSQTVTGAATTFNSIGGLVSGDWIVGDIASDPQVMQVNENGVVSDTELNMFIPPVTTTNAVSWFKTTVGKVVQHMTRDAERLVLEQSSAKTGSVFAAGDVIYGVESGASSTVSVVANQKISFAEPNIRRIDLPGTRISMYSSLNNGASNEETYTELTDTSFYFTNELMIPSRSLEVGGQDPAEFKFVLENTTAKVPMLAGPLLDYGASSLLSYAYMVNNDATDEETPNGNAKAKYVSKLSTLADGMDAEDMVVYLTGYRPIGTDIKVYGRFISESDSRSPYSIGWTELKVEQEFDYYSSSLDIDDYKEYKFVIPDTPSANDDSASFDGTNFQYTYGGVTYPSFKQFSIKIVMLSDSYSKAPKVADVRALALV